MILAVKYTTVNIEVCLTSFKYQIKLKIKKIFSHYKLEKLLKQIVSNTASKKSFSIVVNDNKSRCETWFKPPIQLDQKKDNEIALINLEMYYSFPNIENPTIVLVTHLILTHYGLTLLFLKVVITSKILMSSFNEK